MPQPIDLLFAELEELRSRYPNVFGWQDDIDGDPDDDDPDDVVYEEVTDNARQQWLATAQSKLAVAFPPSYERFLMNYSGAMLAGDEISSLYGPEAATPFDVVVATTLDRKMCGTRSHLIRLVNCEGDVKYYLDTSTVDERGECPVVRWKIESPDKYERFADSFVEFLVRRLKELGPHW